MAIIRHPYFTINQLQEEMNRLFDRTVSNEGENGSVATAEWVPMVDIHEERDRFILLADIPGVDPKDIDITMEKGILSIRGDRKIAGEDNNAFKRIERPRGIFHRRFVLPDTADADRISARGINGVLEIVIPKHERIQPRRIAVAG